MLSDPGEVLRDDDLIPEEPSLGDWVSNTPIAMSKSLARQILLSTRQEPKPFPGIWDWSRASAPRGMIGNVSKCKMVLRRVFHSYSAF